MIKYNNSHFFTDKIKSKSKMFYNYYSTATNNYELNFNNSHPDLTRISWTPITTLHLQ